mmetsp:Transcript_36435/g.102915  ORF Transcript_36435/g.102915 Transcript_36435/m.102915 type:complete len:163 (-) Transcript_36435:116-604(-)
MESWPSIGEMCCTTACCCCSQQFFCKIPKCFGCYTETQCCCYQCQGSLALKNEPESLFLVDGSQNCLPKDLSPLCSAAFRTVICCLCEGAVSGTCDRKIEHHCMYCRNTTCCIDTRVAIPMKDDVPFQVGLLGVMCLDKGGFKLDASDAKSAPKQMKGMTRA